MTNRAKHGKAIWLLVDASNHIYSDFHAAGDKCLELTEARIELMQEKMRKRTAYHLGRTIVCFDSPMSFRRKANPTYKANRSVRPATVGVALAGLREYCLGSEIDVVEVDGYEADDCIATLAKIGVEQGNNVVMASSDKDLRQCLIPGAVSQLLQCRRMNKHVFTRYFTAADLREDYGLEPEQWCDYQVLVGESGDNVRGADGIGPETARKILRTCKSIEAYYQNPWAANLTQRQMQKMAGFRSRWKATDRLIRLNTAVPVPDAWHEAEV